MSPPLYYNEFGFFLFVLFKVALFRFQVLLKLVKRANKQPPCCKWGTTALSRELVYELKASSKSLRREDAFPSSRQETKWELQTYHSSLWLKKMEVEGAWKVRSQAQPVVRCTHQHTPCLFFRASSCGGWSYPAQAGCTCGLLSLLFGFVGYFLVIWLNSPSAV